MRLVLAVVCAQRNQVKFEGQPSLRPKTSGNLSNHNTYPDKDVVGKYLAQV